MVHFVKKFVNDGDFHYPKKKRYKEKKEPQKWLEIIYKIRQNS